MEKSISITEIKAGKRIDKFLQKEVFLNLGVTRGEIIRMIKGGEINVNGKNSKPSYLLKEGDEVSVPSLRLSPGGREGFIIPNPDIKIEIIYQDENIIVVDKPAGLKVHPSGFAEKDTLVNFLVAKFPEMEKIGDGSLCSELRPGIVHRLDQDTSGVMVVARNQKSFDELKKLFQERKVLKKYAALVHGKLEAKKGVIEKSLAKSTNYKKQVIAGQKTKTKVRAAVTEYEVIQEYKDYSLVEAVPKTGRTHQIRIHLFSLGNPVVGDDLYALKKFAKTKKNNRHLLHARQLEFKLGTKKYSFQSELPEDFSQILSSLD